MTIKKLLLEETKDWILEIDHEILDCIDFIESEQNEKERRRLKKVLAQCKIRKVILLQAVVTINNMLH